LFGTLHAAELEDVRTVIDDLVFQPNEAIYLEGETGHALFTVRRGLVKLVRDLSDGEERIVRLQRTADISGIEAFVGAAYKHTAVAMCVTEVCRIPLRVIESLVNKRPDFARQMMLRWQDNLDDADRGLVEFSTGPAEARVARLLLHLSCRSAAATCPDMCRKDMGALLGVTTETASRVMAKFKRGSVFVDIPGCGLCCDRKALEDIAARHWCPTGLRHDPAVLGCDAVLTPVFPHCFG